MESAAGGGVATSPPPFLSKTFDMVDDPSTDPLVSWSNTNNSFVVWNLPDFTTHLLPKYFKHNNFSSFVRQLNTYGFRKVDPDHWEFANEGFLRGHKHLLKSINRRKPSHSQPHQHPAQVQDSTTVSCTEVGKLGIEEDVESLKRDKNVLMQELVRLRQQQQSTDNQLQTVGQRVHLMEQRQQQMMSFLAKAVQSPGFVAQLVNQQNDSNRQISGGNKKRRLPNQDEES
ncbi:UNVERIFIED_CONTAM: Heat stress transcription factor A-1b [Sesamum latifolium]|uniref:Heat stress transcription factor n=1 Tax=Sesamum latifolium TaxID=2727402 RepID=A0AAW2T7V2_9LAMI